MLIIAATPSVLNMIVALKLSRSSTLHSRACSMLTAEAHARREAQHVDRRGMLRDIILGRAPRLPAD
jgi:hypothetical protein